jgi:hypothetical protein
MTDSRDDDLGTQPTTPLFPATADAATTSDAWTADSRTTEVLPRPRIRFGAILWGLLLCAMAAATLWISTDAARREAFGDWLLGLTPGTAGLIATLTIGALLLIWGSLTAIRRAQEREPGM